MHSGAVALANKRGDDATDVLATRGARAHDVDEAHVARVRNEQRLTLVVQSMMCDIVQARAGRGQLAAFEMEERVWRGRCVRRPEGRGVFDS